MLLKVITANTVVVYYVKETIANTAEDSQASFEQEWEQVINFLCVELECCEKTSSITNLLKI